jgi:uncharacterized membrane protein
MSKKGSKSFNAAAARPVETTAAEQDHLGLERLIFFSDAVMAIAITLLALDIRLPAVEGELSNGQLLQSLQAIWPSYLAYAISFLVIGEFWISHHTKFRLIAHYDRNLLLLNLLFLMMIAFIPFPTSVLSEYGNRTATIFYALTIAVTGLLLFSTWFYASYHDRLLARSLDTRQRRRVALRMLVVPVIFLLSIGLAFINDDWAKVSWVLIAVVFRFV